jgi:nuclear pore complex protein Nup155
VHFKAAADEISETKMAAVCAVYVQCSFHYGIIELALERAKKQDPQQQGVLAYESPQSRDETNRSLMMARLNTYRFIFEALTDAHKIKQQGVPANRFPIDDVDSYVKNLFELTIQNNDKLLHYQLYDWFMQQNLKDQLLTINTPYLIPYFQEHVHDKAVSLDFLWKYYRQNDRPYDAALCLETLAKLPSASINLDDRLGCLVQALVNARCAESINVHGSVYIQNLENKVQWAQYQLRVRDILRSLGSNEANMAVNELNQTLFDPQTIEEKYGHLCALRF